MIVKSFARIHQANLVNVGILPLIFDDPADYDALSAGRRARDRWASIAALARRPARSPWST